VVAVEAVRMRPPSGANTALVDRARVAAQNHALTLSETTP
jgi:hypothetical protein